MNRCEAKGLNPKLPYLNQHWNDRNERRRADAAAAHQRALNECIDAGMARVNERQRARWAEYEQWRDAQ